MLALGAKGCSDLPALADELSVPKRVVCDPTMHGPDAPKAEYMVGPTLVLAKSTPRGHVLREEHPVSVSTNSRDPHVRR